MSGFDKFNALKAKALISAEPVLQSRHFLVGAGAGVKVRLHLR